MEKSYIKQIIHSFPYPISVNYKRLRSRECAEPGLERLRHLLATAEATARFLAFITLAECRVSLENQTTKAPVFDRELGDILKRPSFGAWINITRTGLKWLQQTGASLTCTELIDFYYTAAKPSLAAKALDQIVSLRNDFQHDKLKLSSLSDYQQFCQKIEQQLDTLLINLAFLSAYELSFVDQIEVSRQRRQTPKYDHYFALACGSDDQFEEESDKQVQYCLESQVMIFKHQDQPDYLNLDPLYLYEKDHKAPDIYYFNGLKNSDNYHYTPCKIKTLFESNDSQRQTIIQQEIKHLINLFKRPASDD